MDSIQTDVAARTRIEASEKETRDLVVPRLMNGQPNHGESLL